MTHTQKELEEANEDIKKKAAAAEAAQKEDKEAAVKKAAEEAEKEAHTRITYACMFESYTHTHKSSWRPNWPSKPLSRQRTLTRSGATWSVRCFCT